jgi:hypothetical protein
LVWPGVALFASLRLGEKKDQPDERRSLARASTPFNLRGVPIKPKEGITQIVKEWKKMITQSREVAKTRRDSSTPSPWDFKGAALGYL